MVATRILYSINSYDQDGDVAKKGIFFHFGGIRIKVADSVEDLKDIVANIDDIVREIKGNHENTLYTK
jgi:hypothetical protein